MTLFNVQCFAYLQVEKVQSLGEEAVKPPTAYTETQKTWIGVGIGLGATALIVLIYLCVVSHVKAGCLVLKFDPIGKLSFSRPSDYPIINFVLTI